MMILQLLETLIPIMIVISLISLLSSTLTTVNAFTTTTGNTLQQQQSLLRLHILHGSHNDNHPLNDNIDTVVVTTTNNPVNVRRSIITNIPIISLVGIASTSLVLPQQPVNAGTTTINTGIKPVYANDNDIMYTKEHGTSHTPVQENLLYNVNVPLADKICNYNRHFAEPAGYFTSSSVSFLSTIQQCIDNQIPQITFYDSVTSVPLFTFTPTVQRTYDDFLLESQIHGWPSFRDVDVHWDNVRILKENRGEVVSTTGTHLGHNLPDKLGNRYCINLVSISGQPPSVATVST